jgi:Alg9-like mannosyltransferase family
VQRSYVQVSLVNFIQYNVIGGGESSLYGVESWPFYLINGTLNFGVALPAALFLAPAALLGAIDVTSARITTRTAWAVAPLYVWIAAISALPHKEERFLYVVYPQVQSLMAFNIFVDALCVLHPSLTVVPHSVIHCFVTLFNLCQTEAFLACADLPRCCFDTFASAKVNL